MRLGKAFAIGNTAVDGSGSGGGSHAPGGTAGRNSMDFGATAVVDSRGGNADFGATGVVDGRGGNATGGTTGRTSTNTGATGAADGRGGNTTLASPPAARSATSSSSSPLTGVAGKHVGHSLFSQRNLWPQPPD